MTTRITVRALARAAFCWIALGGFITSALAARAIQGSVGQVNATDGAALGQVGFRIWSALAGGESNVNDNVSSCRNARCIRSYVTNVTLDPGGYVGNQEGTQVYNADLAGQPFYELVDASMNDAAGNHIGFFGVSGVRADNSGVGHHLAPDCLPAAAQNCFGRIDANDAGAILVNTQASYGAGSRQIRPISGLNPIPTVNATLPCPSGSVCLSWNDPPTYVGNMRPGTTGPAPPSPVKGLRLYKQFRADCLEPSGDDPNWAPASTPGHGDGRFDLGDTSTQDALPPMGSGCNYYALTVRLVGPGGNSNEIETFRVGAHLKIGGGCEGVVCQPDACHVAGVCDQATGVCVNPPAPDGTGCNDGNPCTQTDSCQDGDCIGSDPIACAPIDQCHAAGICNPATGACSNPPVGDGAHCDDGNACTRTDSCEGGSCTGYDAVSCSALGPCHVAGVCDPGTGVCSDPAAPDGTFCNDGNPCTRSDSCQTGVCTGSNPVTCVPLDVCHLAGACNPGTGICSNPAGPDGVSCDDLNSCTETDSCHAGVCAGSAVPDGTVCDDGDGDACTRSDGCQAGVCTTIVAPDGTICDDGNSCTANDACSSGHCTGEPGVTNLPFLDTFSGPTLDACWAFVDPVGDAAYDVAAGRLNLRAPAGTPHDCWNSGPNCTRAVRAFLDEDAVFETKLDGAALSAANQDRGIILLQDSCNHIRFEYWTAGEGVYVRAYRVIGCVGDSTPAISTGAPVEIADSSALRVTRSGDLFGLEYRIGSGPWTTAGFLTQPGFMVHQAGPFANNAVGNPETIAAVDYFSAVRIGPSHDIRILTGPAGIPSVVASGGAVQLDVAAADTQGHVLGYHWSASCPALGSNGSFEPGPDTAAPRWTAPLNTTGSTVSCALEVLIEDGGGGANRTASYDQRVDTSEHVLEITSISGSPSSLPPGGTAQVSAAVLDSLGHGIVPAWSSSCGGGIENGHFGDPSAGSTIWTAPANPTGGPVDCAITLIVIDGTAQRVTSQSLAMTVQAEGPGTLAVCSSSAQDLAGSTQLSGPSPWHFFSSSRSVRDEAGADEMIAPPDALDALPFLDGFADGLAPGWSLNDPAGDSLLASVSGHVAIAVPSGSSHDCWSGGLRCSRVTRTFPDTNIMFETRIDGARLGAGNHDYGIMLVQNPSNFMRFEYWSGGSGVYVRAYRVINGHGVLPAELSTPDPVALGASNGLRVTRSSSAFTLQYKIDDEEWTTVGTFQQIGFTLSEAGLFANNAVGNPLASGYFDYFSAIEPPSPFQDAPEQPGPGEIAPHGGEIVPEGEILPPGELAPAVPRGPGRR